VNSALYPLKLEPLLRERIWGGSRMSDVLPAARGKQLSNIGEAWIVYDQLAVANGPLAGQRLADIAAQQPAQLLGESVSARQQGVFPLLFKFLDAKDWLSIQVHPDNHYAQVVENQPFGKCEMWYVVSAEPGSQLVHGLNQAMSAAELGAAIADGTLTDKIKIIDVHTGDVVLNLPGTIHALGQGILIYEVQQSSDLTYRVFDWGRLQADGTARELHVDKALDVIKRTPLQDHMIQPVMIKQDEAYSRTILCACDYFAVEKLDIRSRISQSPHDGSFRVLTAIEGAGVLRCDLCDPVEVETGETVLIPASSPAYTLEPGGGTLTMLQSYVPDLERDIVQPLRAIGIPPDGIRQLGGDPGDSHLARYL
jgi:mannose-6-phosphate isomerase